MNRGGRFFVVVFIVRKLYCLISCFYRTQITRLPKISGKEVDLHKLYKVVTLKGGWLKVNLIDL